MTWRPLSLIAVLAAAALPYAVAAQSAPSQNAEWPPAGVARIGAGVQAPTVVKETKPLYTAAAMDAGIQGDLEVEAIVLADGKVGEVRVVRSLDKEYGLDEQAVNAVKQWEFKPGRKDGKPVPVLVNIEVTFRLRK
jgi:protein TonB